MDELIARIIEKHYPEIAQGWHVPVWGVVSAINETPQEGDLSNEYRPRYAISVRLLDKQGNETNAPEMHNIAVAGMFSASGGVMQLPEPGLIVELCFAFGLVNKPYVRSVLPYGVSLPECKPGDVVLQGRKGASIRLENDGAIIEKTDRRIEQQAAQLTQTIGHIQTQTASLKQTIAAHSLQFVGGKAEIIALGALHLLTAGYAELSALESLSLTTASDLNENVAGKKQVLAAGGISLQVEPGAKIEIGSKEVNAIAVLYELCDLVNQLATTLSTHTHPAPMGPTSAPVEAGELGGQASQANTLADKMKILST